MKAHKVTLVFVDHDGIGPDEAKSVLENARYPNRCMHPEILEVQTVDIGEWSDDHPLNRVDPDMKEWKKVFAPPQAPDPKGADKPEQYPTRLEISDIIYQETDANRSDSDDAARMIKALFVPFLRETLPTNPPGTATPRTAEI